MVTGAIYKGFVFDGIDSKQYGVYITGQGVFDAPVRDVEMIEIPGRNGSYALDKGRFKNIEVTFPAGMFGNTDGEFMQGISDLRNALASRKGYCRLTDEYNPNEYRMAVYKSGLEVSPAQLKAGQFDITFDCKPQRFLTSGETQSNVTSGGTITNPTLFDSHPLLLVDGYGAFNVNGVQMTIRQGAVMGRTMLEVSRNIDENPISGVNGAVYEVEQVTNLNDVALAGDKIYSGGISCGFTLKGTQYDEYEISNTQTEDDNLAQFTSTGTDADSISFDLYIRGTTFYKGTSDFVPSAASLSYDWEAWRYGQGSTYATGTDSWDVEVDVSYDGNKTVTTTIRIAPATGSTPNLSPEVGNGFVDSYSALYVDSTKSALGDLYIDLDIGECYRIENGQYISINTATTLPADLPTFKPGANTITYDNTFTSFKVTPRWWKV